ncbi:hypothetical protein EJB05_21304 [Eragrostis curvula]|uniref:Uncharacterized protein n=1 Tax=Eragrostis curvula TaxID=38414 RepID=A0A5J9V0K9_9POAL|nr:hypothetical protein EJB05_21304 [Eragrostis curvula]
MQEYTLEVQLSTPDIDVIPAIPSKLRKMSKPTLFTYFSTSSSANGGSTSTPNTDGNTNAQGLIENTSENRVIEHDPKRAKVEFCFSNIVGDPGNHKPSEHYAVEIRDQAIVAQED